MLWLVIWIRHQYIWISYQAGMTIDRIGVKSCVIRCTGVENDTSSCTDCDSWWFNAAAHCHFWKLSSEAYSPRRCPHYWADQGLDGWRRGPLNTSVLRRWQKIWGYLITMLSSHRTASRHTKWIKSWRWWTSMVQPTVSYWRLHFQAIATWCVHQQTLKANPEGILVRLHSHISWWLSWLNGED